MDASLSSAARVFMAQRDNLDPNLFLPRAAYVEIRSAVSAQVGANDNRTSSIGAASGTSLQARPRRSCRLSSLAVAEHNRSAQAAPTPTSAELKDASSAPMAFPLLTACPGSVRGAIGGMVVAPAGSCAQGGWVAEDCQRATRRCCRARLEWSSIEFATAIQATFDRRDVNDPSLFRHEYSQVPVYRFFVYVRPATANRSRSAARAAYVKDLRRIARDHVTTPIAARDVEVSVLYATSRTDGARADIDNILKPTLDALQGIVFNNDRQVRAVLARLIEKSGNLILCTDDGPSAGLWNSIVQPISPDGVIIGIYSPTRTRELGGHEVVAERVNREALAETKRLWDLGRATNGSQLGGLSGR